jgi:hypothetical protein
MARYIDADALWEELKKLNWSDDDVMYHIVKVFIEDAPTADVVEVKHGEWIVKELLLSRCKNVFCSECGYIERKGPAWDISWGTPNYCPNCGAKMDGGKAE